MSDLKILKLKRSSHRRIKKICLVSFVIALGIFFLFWWQSSSSFSVFSFTFGKETSLKEDQGRVNVLLLGMAGGRHQGATLTDTVMVASYDLKTHKVALISLPRDLWLNKHKAKINTLYQMGLTKSHGLQFAREEIGEILGIEIPYGVRVDFSGFVKAVDLIDGLEVEVERAFADYHYPLEGKEDDLCGWEEKEIEISPAEAERLKALPGKQKALVSPEGEIATSSGSLEKNLSFTPEQVFKLFPCRFEQIAFEEGLQQMSGEEALKFTRSRNGTNNEGTDFARSKRQQLTLTAFKNKVFSRETFLDPGKIKDLVKTFGASLDSDLPQSQYLEFVRLAKKVEGVESFVLDSQGEEPLLIAPPAWEYGAWVLIPQNNDFGKIKAYIQDIFSGKIEASGSGRQN